MSRLTSLRRALEDADLKDEPVVIKGPLSDAFTQALQQIHAKETDESNTDGNVATESAANDQLAMQKLAAAMDNQQHHNLPPTVVYAVDAQNIGPQDVVALTTDMINQEPDGEIVPYAVVINTSTPQAQSGQGGNEAQYLDTSPTGLKQALESIASHYGVKVYTSLEHFAQERYN